MSADQASLHGFQVLIGTWETVATHPMIEGAIPGTVTFEWGPGGQFVVQRTQNDHEQVPDATAVIGPPEDGDGMVMEYFDSRGVRRTYGVSLDAGVMRWWRHEPGFEQRYSAVLAPGAFEASGQLARNPGEWEDDLHVTYRRVED
ncbi:MAG TPA: hypothetical protein VFJ17_08045 [Mycobacteriales bacterium]|jgi:hypothetical protein|nr:hypothetical protein [Mycobacteriales bacterium]